VAAVSDNAFRAMLLVLLYLLSLTMCSIDSGIDRINASIIRAAAK
jgi:hypothetical protein